MLPIVKAFFIATFSMLPITCSAQVAADKTAEYVCILPTENMPQFPGGSEKMVEFISKHLKYPNGRICVAGKVFVEFVVETDGSVTSVKTIKGLHPLFDAEAERVVNLFPKWIPGKVGEKDVRVKMVIPISFRKAN